MQSSTIRRSALTPATWPSVRGLPRARAQRPLPSMMTPICSGIRSAGLSPGTVLTAESLDILRSPSGGENHCRTLHLHYFLFLDGEDAVDLVDRAVGGLLHLLAERAALVLADVAVLLELLQKVHAVAAHVPHRDPRLFGILVRDLGQLTAALLVKLRKRHADDGAFARWIEAEPAVADRLLDGARETAVPDLDAQHPGLGDGNRCELVERHPRPIGLDRDRIEEAGTGTAGAQARQLVPKRVDRLVHPLLELIERKGLCHL